MSASGSRCWQRGSRCRQLAALAVPAIMLWVELRPFGSETAVHRGGRILQASVARLARRRSAATSVPPARQTLPHGPERLSAEEIRAVLASGSLSAESCAGRERLELWGDVVDSGRDNLQPSAIACCASCRELEPHPDTADGAQCNTWVWHPATHECWLKRQPPAALNASASRLARPELPGSAPSSVPWTSGLVLDGKPCAACVVPQRFDGCISKRLCNTSRGCGSPAIDGYAHVDPRCLEESPTARAYRALLASGTALALFHELGADYDGLGVRWGIGHFKRTWADCQAACVEHRPAHFGGGPFGQLPCNSWTWCSAPRCFEPDAHAHSFGDCWLKFQELPAQPEVNQRSTGMLPAWVRRHRREMAAPPFGQLNGNVAWVSGVLLPPGETLGRGTWGPRAYW